MSSASVLVLRAAGINCDHEAVHAFTLAGADRVDLIHIHEFITGRRRLSDYDILMLPGGFSYGDDISAGKVLANELRFKLMDEVEGFIGSGKLVLGVCNGFQVLVKMGFLPETPPGQRTQEATVFYNDSGKFECRWVYLRRNHASPCVFTRDMPDTIYIPVAHGEGKIVPRSDTVLDRLRSSGQIALRYAQPPESLMTLMGITDDTDGKKDGTDEKQDGIDLSHHSVGADTVPYPWSPNGSVDDIAGLCDTTGRIFGLMPHPERHTHPTHHPRWTRERRNEEPDGLYIFHNAVRYVRENL